MDTIKLCLGDAVTLREPAEPIYTEPVLDENHNDNYSSASDRLLLSIQEITSYSSVLTWTSRIPTLVRFRTLNDQDMRNELYSFRMGSAAVQSGTAVIWYNYTIGCLVRKAMACAPFHQQGSSDP